MRVLGLITVSEGIKTKNLVANPEIGFLTKSILKPAGLRRSPYGHADNVGVILF